MDLVLLGAVGLGGLYAIAQSEKQNKKRETMKTIGPLQKQAGKEASNCKSNNNVNASEMYTDQ